MSYVGLEGSLDDFEDIFPLLEDEPDDDKLNDMMMQDFYNRVDIAKSQIGDISTEKELKALSADLNELDEHQINGDLDKYPPSGAYRNQDNPSINSDIISGKDRMDRIYHTFSLRLSKAEASLKKGDFGFEAAEFAAGASHEELSSYIRQMYSNEKSAENSGISGNSFGIDFSRNANEDMMAAAFESEHEYDIESEIKQAPENTAYYHPREGYVNTVGPEDENGNLQDDGYSFDERDDDYDIEDFADTNVNRSKYNGEFDDLLEKDSQSDVSRALGED